MGRKQIILIFFSIIALAALHSISWNNDSKAWWHYIIIFILGYGLGSYIFYTFIGVTISNLDIDSGYNGVYPISFSMVSGSKEYSVSGNFKVLDEKSENYFTNKSNLNVCIGANTQQKKIRPFLTGTEALYRKQYRVALYQMELTLDYCSPVA